MPATSPSLCSRISARKPFLSQYLRYMRSSIEAQSCASVPPAPAWMSMKQLLGSSGLENMRRNSRDATSRSSFSVSDEMLERVASSPSARASSKSSRASPRPPSTRSSVPTTASRDFFSLPSSCARCGLSQSFGSSSSRLSAARRPFFASKSKIPPQFGRACLQVGDGGCNLVEALGIHLVQRRLVLPVLHLVLEARLRLVGPERRHHALAGDGNEGLPQALAHAGKVEVHLAVRALHHEEEEIALFVGRHLRDAQHVAVAKAALLGFEQLFAAAARDADRVGDLGGEIAVAPGVLQPCGDRAQARRLERDQAVALAAGQRGD